jgi:hypothetical protein
MFDDLRTSPHGVSMLSVVDSVEDSMRVQQCLQRLDILIIESIDSLDKRLQ